MKYQYLVINEDYSEYEVCDSVDDAETCVGQHITNGTTKEDIRIFEGRELDFDITARDVIVRINGVSQGKLR